MIAGSMADTKERAWRMWALVARVPGCRVIRVDEEAGAVELVCENEKAKVSLLNETALESAQAPLVAYVAHMVLADMAIGERLTPGRASDREITEAVVRWVHQRIGFIEEPGERFQLADVTLRAGRGDCDCQAVLTVAILTAAGVVSRCVGITDDASDPDAPCTHGVGQARIDGEWIWCETLVDVPIGTDPRGLRDRRITG